MLRDDTARSALHHCLRKITKNIAKRQKGVCLSLLPVHADQSSKECLCSLHNFLCDCALLKSFFLYIYISHGQQRVELLAVLARKYFRNGWNIRKITIISSVANPYISCVPSSVG